MMNKSELEKKAIEAMHKGIGDALVKVLMDDYNSPFKKFAYEVVQEQQEELKKMMREVLSEVTTAEDFRPSVKEAFRHKVARTLVDQLDGEVKAQADKLRQDPTIKAQMILAIQRIIEGA